MILLYILNYITREAFCQVKYGKTALKGREIFYSFVESGNNVPLRAVRFIQIEKNKNIPKSSCKNSFFSVKYIFG